jgi:hypothetical protein
VALPDFHFKGDKEMPSSIAVATRETSRPSFSSTSLNCGMALVALDVERPGEAEVGEFFRRFRDRYPFPPTYRDLTREEVIRCAAEGRHSPPSGSRSIHPMSTRSSWGRIDVDGLGGIDRSRRELRSVQQLSRTVGTISATTSSSCRGR